MTTMARTAADRAASRRTRTPKRSAKGNGATKGNGGKVDQAPRAAKGGEKEEKIKLPPLQIQRIQLRLVGTSPLIVHAWDPKSIEMMRLKQQKGARMPKEKKDPVACFEGAKYKDSKGRECVLARGIKNAIVSAARYSDDAKMTTLRGALFVLGNLLPIKSDKPIMREDMVRVGQGTADIRYRPEYRNWSIPVEIEFNSRVFSAEQIVHLVRLAGFSVGLCEWRPERSGEYGRFEVEAMGRARDVRKRT